MKPRGLVVFDLDGTLLRGPTVCEVLAVPLGRLDEMREFERLSTDDQEGIARMRAEIARWYAEVSREQLLDSLNAVEWAPGVREGIVRLREASIEVAIASITWKAAVDWCAAKLGVTRTLGTAHEDDGCIEHVWPKDKAMWLRELSAALAIPRERTAGVGDSAGDIPMLQAAGLGVFVGQQPPPGLECVHLPAAGIDEVARTILERWDLGRYNPAAAVG